VVEEKLGAADPLTASRLLWVKASISAETDAGQAIQFLQQALALYPDNLPALLSLAELYLAAADLRKAHLYLSMAAELDPENPELRLRLEQTEDAAR
jgi:cytochrome c-type biogenesis protein CcmH/NrfG